MRVSTPQRRGEGGMVTVFFALFLTVLMVIGSVVISVGSWYTHARQLQTKVDAAALAGGGAWSFPCTPETDTRIASTARLFFGEHTDASGTSVTGSYNQQIGGVEGNQLYVALNQADWWDDSFSSVDFSQPAGSVCEAKSLDVKATEADSPLLWGWLPFAPDIKKRARVALEEARALQGALPVAIRVPGPVSTAAVIFNEETGDILAVRYFDPSDVEGLPSGLEGFTTRSEGTPPSIASLPRKTGVAIALSFVPECAPDITGDCFEDQGFATVNDLCNQGPRAIVTCYAGSGSWPTRNVTTGLHFMRGYATSNVSNGAPELQGAYLDNAGCESNGYFNSFFTGSCGAKLTVGVDLGNGANRIADNVQVSYRLVRRNGTSSCDTWCPLRPLDPGDTGLATYETAGNASSPHAQLNARSEDNAIAIRIRVRRNNVPSKPTCSDANFNPSCEWYHLGSGINPPVNASPAPSAAAILASPVQRAYMGDLDKNGAVKWVRVNKDTNCDGDPEVEDGAAATHPSSSASCYSVDMGLKGGMARDQDEPPFAFLEGSGPSQLGSLDCDPNIPQGQLEDAVVNGCSPWYAKNSFSTTPLCPGANQFFNLPKPPPFDDWPPYDCVKTRNTDAGNQLIRGLNLRIFGSPNAPSCPEDDPEEYVRGRNYWHRLNNEYTDENFAWNRDTATTLDDQANRINPNDPRLVILFFTPYDSLTGSGNQTFPIVNLGHFYITGYGRSNGSGGFQGGGPDDPCSDGNGEEVGAGNSPPADLNILGGQSGGAVIWGHFVKPFVQSGGALGSTGKPCDANSMNPCVAVLVE